MIVTRLADWVLAQSELERRRGYGVALCMMLYLFHVLWFSSWLIEDAAISMAYADHFAHGEGFVTNPGGGWVEGFSNPTWTLLLSLTSWLGLSPWVMVKVLGIGSGWLTLPLAYSWAKRTHPDAPGLWPVLAPLVLAMSTPFALWASSGLENGLFNLLLAAGAVGILRDTERPSWGFAGLLLGALAFTRPEAPLYAGFITVLAGPFAFRTGGVRWLAGFFLTSAGPFFAWHLWRVWSFAWPFPNTYYAKQTENKFAPFQWNKSGWTYLRRWAAYSVHGPMIPLFTFGQTGIRGARAGFALVATGTVLGVLIPGVSVLRNTLDLPAEPDILVHIRVGVLVLAVVLFPLVGLARTGHLARTLAWGTATIAMFFAVYTGGDWMRGFRWLSMATVPLAVLAADGAYTLAPALRDLGGRWIRWLNHRDIAATLITAPLLIAGIVSTVNFMIGIETTPFDVRRRVLYMQGVAERLDLERPSLLDVDMGAHMIWSGFEMTDLAGLCDVPFAHNHYDRGFIDTYIGEERLPTFAHLHGGWANKSGITRRPWFKSKYLEIAGYGHSRTQFHIGNHIRRDLLVRPRWTKDATRQTSFGSLHLEGLILPSPTAHPGGHLQVELGWSIRGRPPGFRALFFLHDGEQVRSVHDLPPAYDWLRVPIWRQKQVVHGQYGFTLPDDLPEGRYTIGLVVIEEGHTGSVMPAELAMESPALFMEGDVHWSDALTIAPRDQVLAEAEAKLASVETLAAQGSCESAEAAWHQARHYTAPKDDWQPPSRRRSDAALANCWAARALETRTEAAIVRARSFDHRQPAVAHASEVLADEWQAQGDAAMDSGDEEEAWKGWSRAIRADPARPWLRRQIEELRAKRLSQDPKK